MKLQNRVAIITGASQGLGASIAEHFVAEGASVMLCARSLNLLQQLQNRLSPHLFKDQQIHVHRTDVAKPEEVDRLFEATFQAFPRLDILVNNAGIYGPMGAIEEIDWKEWQEAITINLMGTVYPCRAAVRHFKKNRTGKIINISGGGATNPMPRISAYAASKAAVVRFTESLALEVAGNHIDVNAVAPGALATKMTDQLLAAGPEKVGAKFYERMVKIKEEGGTPLEKGAKLCVYLASKESDGVTGRLISAIWDPWPFTDEVKSALNETDIYTLRRIVPEDRGKKW